MVSRMHFGMWTSDIQGRLANKDMLNGTYFLYRRAICSMSQLAGFISVTQT